MSTDSPRSRKRIGRCHQNSTATIGSLSQVVTQDFDQLVEHATEYKGAPKNMKCKDIFELLDDVSTPADLRPAVARLAVVLVAGCTVGDLKEATITIQVFIEAGNHEKVKAAGITMGLKELIEKFSAKELIAAGYKSKQLVDDGAVSVEKLLLDDELTSTDLADIGDAALSEGAKEVLRGATEGTEKDHLISKGFTAEQLVQIGKELLEDLDDPMEMGDLQAAGFDLATDIAKMIE